MSFFLPRAASRALCCSARPALRIQRPTAAAAAPPLRRGITLPAEQPRLRLGSIGMLILGGRVAKELM